MRPMRWSMASCAICGLIVAVVAGCSSMNVPGGDAAAGQTLWQNRCVSCHNGSIAQSAANTDSDDVVENLGAVDSAMAGITLTAQEVADVRAYLNTQ